MGIPGFNLLLQDFCAYCPDFEPVITKESFSPPTGDRACTTIRCFYQEKCAGVARRIERNLRNDRV